MEEFKVENLNKSSGNGDCCVDDEKTNNTTNSSSSNSSNIDNISIKSLATTVITDDGNNDNDIDDNNRGNDNCKLLNESVNDDHLKLLKSKSNLNNCESLTSLNNCNNNENYDKTTAATITINTTKQQQNISDRRPDEPTELSFDKVPENKEEKDKRIKIENSLKNPLTTIKEWQEYALSDYGLISDDLRREIWPRLIGIDLKNIESAPKLYDLKSHPEYNQVILDVNRSLKRFPPGIPYEQRIALQDQLTVLILRVITKYPNLKYYQGYHDVAITFLLVVGEEVAFYVMEYLSTNHLVECMQETMEPTQRRLMFIYPIIQYENLSLYNYLQKSSVGTLFALPWYLTWFGHSLNSYRSVVRLYDFFLASPFLLPLYVTASIVLYRADDIFKEDCDMASIHCLLSQLPDDLPFEYLLRNANELYRKYPPSKIEIEVDEMIIREKQQRALEEEQAALRRKQLLLKRRQIDSAAAVKNSSSFVHKILPHALLSRRSVIVTTAFSILVGICAYYYKAQILSVGIR